MTCSSYFGGGSRNMDQLSKKIKKSLLKEGASLVSFADLKNLPSESTRSMPYAISIAVALNPSIIAKILQGPTLEYYEEYQKANLFLSYLGKLTANILQDWGYNAIALEPTTENFNPDTLSTPLPHKTIATRAGLGWIGKSALLITQAYGSAIRFTSVLTNVLLEVSTPENQTHCGECTICVDNCPGHAPSGKNWEMNLPREIYFNAFSCQQTAQRLSHSIGIDATICGICIASCPWTKKYLMKYGFK